MAKNENIIKIVNLLVEVAKVDTVYRDVHLRRARELLKSTLDESSYRAIGSTEKEIDDLMRRSRTAALRRDWGQAAELAERVEVLRQRLVSTSELVQVGRHVYDAEPVAFDPFSLRTHLGAQAELAQPLICKRVMDALSALAKLDTNYSSFYESRRGYFAALEVSRPPVPTKRPGRNRAQAEQLAVAAAERGDVATLQRFAKELRDWKQSDDAAVSGSAPALLSRYECCVDLAAPFPPQVIERAREYGLVEANTAPIAELAKVREVIYAHVDPPVFSDAGMERDGVLRTRELAEREIPVEFDTEDVRVLVAEFIQQVLINSAGARYLPQPFAEKLLIEDFSENETTAGAPSKLVTALELPGRSGRARTEIEVALTSFGDQILAEQLGLDPHEFRLVCVPFDVYARFGRDRGYGQWPHRTHFDGYRVIAGNQLRALVGGDRRFGGLFDLVSISPSDAREDVYARFAVVRRARMSLRWR